MAAVGVYIGVALIPGLNDTISTVTTPTYDSGKCYATFKSNLNVKTFITRWKLNLNRQANTELNTKLNREMRRAHSEGIVIHTMKICAEPA
jgi:hypothetical protein